MTSYVSFYLIHLTHPHHTHCYWSNILLSPAEIDIELQGEIVPWKTSIMKKIWNGLKLIANKCHSTSTQHMYFCRIEAVVGEMPNIFRAQILSYLKASGLKVGLLINFGNESSRGVINHICKRQVYGLG